MAEHGFKVKALCPAGCGAIDTTQHGLEGCSGGMCTPGEAAGLLDGLRKGVLAITLPAQADPPDLERTFVIEGVTMPEEDFRWADGEAIYTDGGVIGPSVYEVARGAVAAVQFVGNNGIRGIKMLMPLGYQQATVTVEHLAMALV